MLPPLFPFLAPGRCFWTWVLIIYQFFFLSLPLQSFAITSILGSFNFPKARCDDFAVYFKSHCPSAEKSSSFSLSSAAALFTSLPLNAAKSSVPFGRIKRHPKAWWSAEVEGAVNERRKEFGAAHSNDEDRQASRRASSVVAKAMAEAWQTTCSSLLPKSNPKILCSILRSTADSPSSFSSSPNFTNYSSTRESASVYAAYVRSHFSISQPKALRSRVRGYFSELNRATFPEESHSFFCSSFSSAEFLSATSSLSTLLLPFRAISQTFCLSKLFECIIPSRLLFFLKSNSILSPHQGGFRWTVNSRSNSVLFSVHFGWV